MSHTPDQARALWCPMARIARRENTQPTLDGREVIVGGCNTDALGGVRVPASCRCIAEKCAMWRWVPGGRKNSAGAMHPNTRGYCGIAGWPEVTACS